MVGTSMYGIWQRFAMLYFIELAWALAGVLNMTNNQLPLGLNLLTQSKHLSLRNIVFLTLYKYI